MTDRSHRHAKTVKTIRESIRAEIKWREQLIDQYLCSSDPTMNDVVEAYTHLKRKHKGDVHLNPGGDSWATVRTRDILKDFGVWDEVHGHPVYEDADRTPLSRFAYMSEDGLDVEYIESLVEESARPDADVTCIEGIAYIRETVGETRFEVEIDFYDLDGKSAYNAVMRQTNALDYEVKKALCDHSIIEDPGLDGTPSEGDLLVCEHCPYTEVTADSDMDPEPHEIHSEVTRRD